MADAVVSAVLQQLVTIIYEQAKEEVKLVVGVNKEIENLRSNFQAIQGVLQDAEMRQVKEASVRDWLNKLQELSYDVEDVLDDWKTALLRFKIRRLPSKRSRNKVRSFLSSSPCFCVNQIALRHDIGNEIKELNEKLKFINSQKQGFGFVIHERVAINEERPKTTSFIDVEEVHGRKEDKISIKSMLLSPTSGSGKEEQRVISIVGMGGIGKTTLAQSVYNDEEVTRNFDLKIWICVSDSFDETRMVKEIFEKCFGKRPSVDAIDIMLQQIREHISEKKVLFVLDDVWTEEITKWDQLTKTLKCTVCESRILVTTRKKRVAVVLGSRKEVDILALGILDSNDSWLLFSRFAFHDRTGDEKNSLEDVGRKIMDKCEGLPLAIKIIGSHLRFKRSRQEWEHVLMSDTWKIKDAEKALFGPLLLSYYELPHAAKRCFIHCALFPKAYNFEKNELIRLWMAQGFCGEGKEVELKAEECFDDLVMRSFLHDFSKFEEEEYAKMHDIVHDFAMFLSGGECCYSEDFNEIMSLTKEEFGKSTRHIFLFDKNNKSLRFPSSINGCEKLRSMHIDCSRMESDNLSTLDWKWFKCLRSLKMKDASFERLTSEIGKLKHLRHLDLSDNSLLRVLPEEICDLCNLETLDISSCDDLEKLPRGIGELINLKYLTIKKSCFDCAAPMPKGIARLVDVKEIVGFVVGSGENDASLADLGNLLNLEVVRIDGLGNIRDAREGMKARLGNKSKLKKLKLCFKTTEDGEVEEGMQEQLLEALSPPPSLEVLSIEHYSGRLQYQLPSWMQSLRNLKYLELHYLSESEQLPPLGKLFPTLEVLCIWHVQRVKKVGAEFLGTEKQHSSVVFPNLKKLCFCMPDCEEWDWSEEEEEEELAIMPRLIELEIDNCDKLTAIPRQLLRNPGLQNLYIRWCPILERRYRQGTGVEWPIVSHIPSILIR